MHCLAGAENCTTKLNNPGRKKLYKKQDTTEGCYELPIDKTASMEHDETNQGTMF